MGPLVSVGGIHVPGEKVRKLELALDELCRETGFPEGEEFKWSPRKNSWEYLNLKFEDRDEFHVRALRLANDVGATAIVVLADTTKGKAHRAAASHEEDVTRMFLERAEAQLGPAHGLVVADRPGGGRQAETQFLARVLETLRTGTAYTQLTHLALAVSTDSKLSRLLQLADVVTACTTNYIAVEPRFAPPIFEAIRPLLRTDYGCIGGRGVKIHPDFRYGNLYHWLLGDERFVRYQGVVTELPSRRFTSYRDSPEVA
jgi:hypothetical protein